MHFEGWTFGLWVIMDDQFRLISKIYVLLTTFRDPNIENEGQHFVSKTLLVFTWEANIPSNKKLAQVKNSKFQILHWFYVFCEIIFHPLTLFDVYVRHFQHKSKSTSQNHLSLTFTFCIMFLIFMVVVCIWIGHLVVMLVWWITWAESRALQFFAF